jgi:hypothetical protein
MKRVVDLKNDEDLNAASWEAARGAAYGASTVCAKHQTILTTCRLKDIRSGE